MHFMLRQLHSVQLTSNCDYACRRVRVEAQLSRRTLSLRKKWIFTAVPAACLRIEMIVPAALTLLHSYNPHIAVTLFMGFIK